MANQPRRFKHERQPLLPINETAKEINRRDRLRESSKPEQLELLIPDQRDLFVAGIKSHKTDSGR